MTLDEIKIKQQEAAVAYSSAFVNLSDDLSWSEFEKIMKPYNNEITKWDREYRMLKVPEFSPLSVYGDLMSLENFIETVNTGGFIDYDGHGYYVKDNQESNISIHPSDVKYGKIRNDFDQIIWFNR